jgi:hypothetical protein
MKNRSKKKYQSDPFLNRCERVMNENGDFHNAHVKKMHDEGLKNYALLILAARRSLAIIKRFVEDA